VRKMVSSDFDMERIQRLSHVSIEQAADGIFWLDHHARILRTNKAARGLLGYTEDELLNMSVPDFHIDFSIEGFRKMFESHKQSGSLHLEACFRRKDGTIFPVEINSHYVFFEGTDYTCASFRDITHRKRRETELQQALMELEELKDRLQEENIYLQEEIKVEHNFGEIIGHSKVLKEVLWQIEQVAGSESTVLILGETGTGKELFARAVHNLSPRKRRPLVKVNCATLPLHLMESDLFGHEKGAFTGAIKRKIGKFELAHGGTIFLDEIGELPRELQVKLLRVLQEGELERLGDPKMINVDVRVIAATNRDLEQMVQANEFRRDLYYRLNVYPVHCPPLRSHKSDVPLLVKHFLNKHGPKIGKTIEHVPVDVMNALKSYPWPGNVRELENIIQRALIISKGNRLEIINLPLLREQETTEQGIPTLDELEKNHITEVLEITSWRVSGKGGAAEKLGLKPTTLEARMKKLGIYRNR
jgi:formate hydrogenlyase transcriptional activator